MTIADFKRILAEVDDIADETEVAILLHGSKFPVSITDFNTKDILVQDIFSQTAMTIDVDVDRATVLAS